MQLNLKFVNGHDQYFLPYRFLVEINYFSLNRFKHQYSKTNVMHFLFNLVRIKDLYMFRELLAHPQEALHNGLRVMSVRCTRITAPVWNSNPGAAN
jgi:hypothetical protein